MDHRADAESDRELPAGNRRGVSLLINEIYLSVQGESSYTGLPCVFVRLTGCDLRCAYCDSVYAFQGGERLPLEEVMRRIEACECPLVEITGGEPLLQKGVYSLMEKLCDAGKTVLIETSGAHDLSKIDPRVIRIVDLKCPSSGECDRNHFPNLDLLRPSDEIKFVIGTREDFEWARDQVLKHRLDLKTRCVLFSPTFKTPSVKGVIRGHEGLNPRVLVEWILKEKLPVRFQLQIHKHIWEPTQRGV